MTDIEKMVGVTFCSLTGGAKGDGSMRFVASDGSVFLFTHEQDCCESVRIEDVNGDTADLLGSPMLRAEEVSSDDAGAPKDADSFTWTFYKFETNKGSVTVRWLGESNGFYSERVDLIVTNAAGVKPAECEE